MKTFEQIQQEISAWSAENFGDQISKYSGCPMGQDAPLMGMVEELGEYYAAETKEEQLDALADMSVYACDFIGRASAEDDYDYLPTMEEIITADVDEFTETSTALGKLFHLNLKRHQGIRKVPDEVFKQTKKRRITEFLAFIKLETEMYYEISFLENLNNVWEKVSKRNWKSNPNNGA